VVRETNYQLNIASQLYTLGLESIPRRCVLDHEILDIFWECPNGVARVHIGGKKTTHKILHVGFWWMTVFKESKNYARNVMSVNGLVSCPVGMSCHYTLFAHCRHLRSGSWTSSVPLIHQLNTQRIDTSSLQSIT
jgi:hypothetical protein